MFAASYISPEIKGFMESLTGEISQAGIVPEEIVVEAVNRSSINVPDNQALVDFMISRGLIQRCFFFWTPVMISVAMPKLEITEEPVNWPFPTCQ